VSSPSADRRPLFTRQRVFAVGLVVAVLIIGALWQRTHPYSIQTSADIDASPSEVWAVLTDYAAYPEWNPTQSDLAGATVVETVPNRTLRWQTTAGIVGIFDGERTFSLEKLDDGSTRLTQSELFRGIVVPFVGASLKDETAPGFHEMNAALRERVER
jgi:hypothetical protein